MSDPASPRLSGNLAEVYRARVSRVREALAAEGGAGVLGEAWSLVEWVEVHPPASARG